MKPADRAAYGESLPAGIREEIDGYVLRDALLGAVGAVVDVGLVPHGIGIAVAQQIVSDRYRHYGDRVALDPPSPLDLDSPALKAAGFGEPIAYVEAVWDGDTVHDWFVVLLAVTEEDRRDRALATVYRRTAEKYLGTAEAGTHRLPHSVAAQRAGRALAEHLGVPFYFTSPDDPDDEAPRWGATPG
ncbi:hypothetical protein ACGFX4_02695 [Kitasatospora sp. NPDC048365]|uniref:hypothetical protein n=1 Tax=Kitasatospora sp. NPDC048365 TaxID=3364050 RepID=UPI003712F2F5